MARTAIVPAYALLASGIAACGGDAPIHANGCRHPVCDIRATACQAALWTAATCDRGAGSGAMPPLRVIHRDAFRAELEAADAASPPPPNAARVDTGLQLIGLLPAGTTQTAQAIETRVANTTAYYSSDDKVITVIDRGTSMGATRDTAVLVHEMVHAIQDARYDLRDFVQGARDTDALLARRAIVEGDATLHEAGYVADVMFGNRRRAEWESYYARWLAASLTALAEETTVGRWPLARTWVLYPVGGRFVTRFWLRFDDLDALYASPPAGMADLMATGPSGAGGTARRSVGCADTDVAGGRVVARDHLGPVAVFAWLAGLGVPPDAAWNVATTVRGDQFEVYLRESTGRTLVRWRLRTPTAVDAVRVAQAGQRWTGTGRLVQLAGADLVLAASDDAAWLDAAREAVFAPCAP